MYDASFELCLRHLHMQTVPLREACNVQQLLENRAMHALDLPGRYVPATDGSVSTLTSPEAEGAPEAFEADVSAGGLSEAQKTKPDPPEDVQCFVCFIHA